MIEDKNIFEGEATEEQTTQEQATQVDDRKNLADDIFGEVADEPEKSDNQQKKTKDPAKEVKKPNLKENLGEKKSDNEKKANESKAEADIDDDEDVVDRRQSEIEKLKKNLNDSQKWGHTNNRRLKKVAKLVESLKESGVLNESEFNDFNEYISSDPEEEERIESITRSPLESLVKVANKRVEDLREIYEDDELFDRKISAFDEYYNSLSKDEKEEIIEDLENIKGNELKLAKRMYQMGGKYYEEELKEIEEAGGFKKLLSKKDSELERMQKKLDKLTNKLLQYEDYDKPTYKVEESGDTSNLVKSKNYDSFVEEIFGERDRRIGR